LHQNKWSNLRCLLKFYPKLLLIAIWLTSVLNSTLLQSIYLKSMLTSICCFSCCSKTIFILLFVRREELMDLERKLEIMALFHFHLIWIPIQLPLFRFLKIVSKICFRKILSKQIRFYRPKLNNLEMWIASKCLKMKELIKF